MNEQDKTTATSAQALIERADTVLAPTYPHQPRRAIEFLLGYIRQELARTEPERLLLIGSSLGGFYGQYLARVLDCSLVLINPALDPVATLRPCVGENRMYHTDDRFVFPESDLLALNDYAVDRPCDDPVPTLLLVGWDDEVIDSSIALGRYQSCGQYVAFDGGNHGFAHLAESLGYIQQLYWHSERTP